MSYRMGWMAMVAAIGCTPSTPPVTVQVDLHTKQYKLANGLEVVLEEDHQTPKVAVRMRYHSGSKDDDSGKGGLAHLVEHVTFAATRHVPRDGVLDLLSTLGAGDANGTTYSEATDYYASIPASQLDAMLWVEADQMAYVEPTAAIVDRERSIVEQERRQNDEDRPYGNVPWFLSAGVFPEGHPYRNNGIGSEEEISKLSLEDVIAFRQRHYSPDNATLVVVGDIDMAATTAAIEHWFGSIPPHGEARVRNVAPVTKAAVPKLRVEADVPHTQVVIGWPLPAPTSDGYWEATIGLEMIADRVRKHLVTDLHVATTAATRLWTRRCASEGSIVVEGADKLKESDVIDDVAYARRQLSAATLFKWVHTERTDGLVRGVFAVEQLADRGKIIQDNLDFYADPNATQDVLRRIGDLQAPNVSDAIGAFFDPDDATVLVVVPTKGAPRGGRLVAAR